MGEGVKNILIKAPYWGDTGYAVVNRNIIFSLYKLGYNIYLEPVIWASNDAKLTPEVEALLAKIQENGIVNVPVYDDCIILNLTMPELYHIKMRGQNIGWYIFEADRVPNVWVEAIKRMDGIIVPTEFHKKQVLDIGYTGKIYILQEGVNPELFNPEVKPILKTGKFTFLTVAVAQERKRWREIITCYLEEFNKEKTCLLLKLTPTGLTLASAITNHIKQERARTGSNAEIILRTTPIDGCLAGLYASANCYISLGNEGLDCPACEAIAC